MLVICKAGYPAFYIFFLKRSPVGSNRHSGKTGKESMEYYSLNQYPQGTFGEKVCKNAPDGDFSRHSRDGDLGSRGCIFCPGAGSGEFAGDRQGGESLMTK